MTPNIVPPSQQQTLQNAIAFLSRVQTTGIDEARELVRCAELLAALANPAKPAAAADDGA
jgi:hypothetical protein